MSVMINVKKSVSSLGVPKVEFELSGVLTKTTFLSLFIETTQIVGGPPASGFVNIFTGDHIFGTGKLINIFGSKNAGAIHHKMILYGAMPSTTPYYVNGALSVDYGHEPRNPFGSKMWIYKDFTSLPFDDYELELPVVDGKINVYVLQFFSTLNKPRLTSHETCEATEDSLRLFSFDRSFNSSF